MNRPQHVRYGSPDFIAVARSVRSRDVSPRGWLFLLQGGAVADHLKAAQYIAFETGFRLVKIELSKVLSKYIGETEKNLNAVFEQTKSSRVILFFDEVDVLFNSRSDQEMIRDIFQILREMAEKTKRIMILSHSRSKQIEKSSLEKMDVVVEFRRLK